ncbi:MAG: transcriptional repressor TraM [Pseudorhizobium sp.]
MEKDQERHALHSDVGAGSGNKYEQMPKNELEALVIKAIREHRRLLAADELVYEEWTTTEGNPIAPQSVVQALQGEHLLRQAKSRAQQHQLSQMLDALGYVPHVPVDGED